MNRKTLLYITAGAGIVLTFALSLFLPERVATHFNFSGEPNAWSSNMANTVFYVLAFLIMNLLFWGIGLLVRKLPTSLINIPNRDYWLAPDRREKSYVDIGDFMAEFGVFINAYLMAIELASFTANRTQTPLSPHGLIFLASAFTLYLVLWLVRFLLRFRKPA